MASLKRLHRHPMNHPGRAVRTASGAARVAKAFEALAEWGVFRQALCGSIPCAAAAHQIPVELRQPRSLPGIRECDTGQLVLRWAPLGPPQPTKPADEPAPPTCVTPATALPDRESPSNHFAGAR